MSTRVTGTAGFIGSHVCHRLLDRGEDVARIDNMNDYYDPAFNQACLQRLLPRPGFRYRQAKIVERETFDALQGEAPIRRIVHLAAQVASAILSLKGQRDFHGTERLRLPASTARSRRVGQSIAAPRSPTAPSRRSAPSSKHVFAEQKSRMGLVVRTIGIARARTKIGMANLAYALNRFVWHHWRTAPA